MVYSVKIINCNSEVYIYYVEDAPTPERAKDRALLQYKYGTNNLDIKSVKVVEGLI